MIKEFFTTFLAMAIGWFIAKFVREVIQSFKSRHQARQHNWIRECNISFEAYMDGMLVITLTEVEAYLFAALYPRDQPWIRYQKCLHEFYVGVNKLGYEVAVVHCRTGMYIIIMSTEARSAITIDLHLHKVEFIK